MIGTEHDCQRCACPLVVDSNNFSPSCKLKEIALESFYSANSSTSDFVCTNCAEGHIGNRCELCDDGYYGSPMELGSKCLPCECDGEPCDAITGKCIQCLGNTEGWHCERCKIGYWGDPAEGCEMCDCDDSGAINNLCDVDNGKCVCKTNYQGDTCNECEEGFANLSLNCPPCQCHNNGSESVICDTDNGQCLCKANVHGLNCDECDELYFGLSEKGCEGECCLPLAMCAVDLKICR